MGVVLLLLVGLAFGPSHALADCFGAVFDTLSNGFQYKANLVLPSECSGNETRVTRLFIAGACGMKHNNNFNGYPPACPKGDFNILNTSRATCNHVFSTAQPWDIKPAQGNETFDSGTICNNGIKSVLFVQTNCTQLNASSVVLQQHVLADEFCWDGNTLSHAALAGIVVGSVVGFCLLIGVPCGLIVWYRQRRLNQRAKLGGRQELSTSSSWLYSRPSALAGLPPQPSADEDKYDAAYDIELQQEHPDARLM